MLLERFTGGRTIYQSRERCGAFYSGAYGPGAVHVHRGAGAGGVYQQGDGGAGTDDVTANVAAAAKQIAASDSKTQVADAAQKTGGG